MSDQEKQRWYRLPKNRPEALPFLVLCLLPFVPGFFTLFFALVHIWLWLRHPRSRSRYLAAAIPFGLGGLRRGQEDYVGVRLGFRFWI